MNIKTTIALIILAFGCFYLFWKGGEWGKAPEATSKSETVKVSVTEQKLASLSKDKITHLLIENGKGKLELKVKKKGEPLTLAGNWPVRSGAVDELLNKLSNLSSRFLPISIDKQTDLSTYGLTANDDKVKIVIETVDPDQTIHLVIGNGKKIEEENPFITPAYLQLQGENEILQLGPDLMPLLQRNPDYYRRRQIFPEVERLRLPDASTGPNRGDTPLGGALVSLLGDKVSSIRVRNSDIDYELKRIAPMPKPLTENEKSGAERNLTLADIASVWQLNYPVLDNVNPTLLKPILSEIPNLWVEKFLDRQEIRNNLQGDESIANGKKIASDGDLLKAIDLDGGESTKKITIRYAGVSVPRTLLIGKSLGRKTRTEPAPPPAFPGAPPQKPKIIVQEAFYAKLLDSPEIFSISSETMDDIFFVTKGDKTAQERLAELRDPKLVRFETDEVQQLEVLRPQHNSLLFKKTKKDTKVENNSSTPSRWEIVKPFSGLAQFSPIADLLNGVESLSVKSEEIIDLDQYGLLFGPYLAHTLLDKNAQIATMVLTIAEPKSESNPTTVSSGSDNIPKSSHSAIKKIIHFYSPIGMLKAQKKLICRVEGNDRLNLVPDTILTNLEKPARVYRALKLFDLNENHLSKVQITQANHRFELVETPEGKEKWQITAPFNSTTEIGKTTDLVKTLENLEATEYVYDTASLEDLHSLAAVLGTGSYFLSQKLVERFGLQKPSIKMQLEFSGSKSMPAVEIWIGNESANKDSFYAKRRDSENVFTLNKKIVDQLKQGELSLLPLELWPELTDPRVTKIEIQKLSQRPFSLQEENQKWLVPSLPGAIISQLGAQMMASSLAKLKVEKYFALADGNLQDYRLDKPILQLQVTLKEKTKKGAPGKEEPETQKSYKLLIGGMAPVDLSENTSDDMSKKQKKLPGHFAKLDGEKGKTIFIISDEVFRQINRNEYSMLVPELLQLDASTISDIQIENQHGKLQLIRENKNWQPQGISFPLDSPALNQLEQGISSLVADRFVDYGKEVNWQKYGLDAAAKPAQIKLKAAGKEHRIEIGHALNPNNPMEGYYVRADNGQGVAVLPGPRAEILLRPPFEYADHTLLQFNPAEVDTWQRKKANETFEIKVGTSASWDILQPVKHKADQDTMEDLVNRLANLRANRILAVDGKNLEKFGLANPSATITLTFIDRKGKLVEKTIKIGNAISAHTENKSKSTVSSSPLYAVNIDGSSLVGTIPSALAKKLLADPIKYWDKNIAGFVSADKIEIDSGLRKVIFSRRTGKWNVIAPLSADAEDDALRETYDSLAKLRADEVVADKVSDLKKYGFDNPAVTWKIWNGDKELYTLYLGKPEIVADKESGFASRRYAKLSNSDIIFLVDGILVDKLSAEYRQRLLWDSIDVAKAKEINVSTPESATSFRLIRQPTGWIDPKFPEALNQKTINDFLDVLAAPKAEHYIVDKNADPQLYGLGKNATVLTVTLENGTQRQIRLGRVDDQQRVYGQVVAPNRSDVFVLSTPDTKRVLRQRKDFYLRRPPVNNPIPDDKNQQPKKGKATEPGKEPVPKKNDSGKEKSKSEQPKSIPKETKKEDSKNSVKEKKVDPKAKSSGGTKGDAKTTPKEDVKTTPKEVPGNNTKSSPKGIDKPKVKETDKAKSTEKSKSLSKTPINPKEVESLSTLPREVPNQIDLKK